MHCPPRVIYGLLHPALSTGTHHLGTGSLLHIVFDRIINVIEWFWVTIWGKMESCELGRHRGRLRVPAKEIILSVSLSMACWLSAVRRLYNVCQT